MVRFGGQFQVSSRTRKWEWDVNNVPRIRKLALTRHHLTADITLCSHSNDEITILFIVAERMRETKGKRQKTKWRWFEIKIDGEKSVSHSAIDHIKWHIVQAKCRAMRIVCALLRDIYFFRARWLSMCRCALPVRCVDLWSGNENMKHFAERHSHTHTHIQKQTQTKEKMNH